MIDPTEIVVSVSQRSESQAEMSQPRRFAAAPITTRASAPTTNRLGRSRRGAGVVAAATVTAPCTLRSCPGTIADADRLAHHPAGTIRRRRGRAVVQRPAPAGEDLVQ